MSVAYQLTNRSLLVNIDYEGNIVDFSWPDKGETNLCLRSKFQELIYVDGKELTASHLSEHKFGFIDEKLEVSYQYELLNEFSLRKSFRLRNNSSVSTRIDIFTHTPVDFGSNKSRDTAVYSSSYNGVIHYEDDQYLLVSSDHNLHNYACHSPNDNNRNGALPDRYLNITGNPVATGWVESSLQHQMTLEPDQELEYSIYYVCASSYEELALRVKLNEVQKPLNLKKNNIDDYLGGRVADLSSRLELDKLRSEKLSLLAKRSYELVVGSFTKSGGTFAAVDSSYYKKNGVDDYAYFWPRDGALTLLARLKTELMADKLDKQSIEDYVAYFKYLAKCFAGNPYLLHRYRLNERASLASSWYTWEAPDKSQALPLQLDQTALSLYAYSKFKRNTGISVEELEYKLNDIARFLVESCQGSEHIACYDPWENDWGKFLSTQFSLIAGLKEVSHICEPGISAQAAQTAQRMSGEISAKYYDQANSQYNRGYIIDEHGVNKDSSADSLIHWGWYLNVIAADREEYKLAILKSAEQLKVAGGFARYNEDHYLRVSSEYTGNPWYISTLLFANFYMQLEMFAEAKAAIEYVLDHMEVTGILAEMADPNTGFSLSVRPLIWSHAELLNLLNWKDRFN